MANHNLNRHTRAPEDLTGDPIYDAPALLQAQTVYDRAHAAGLRTAAIDWPDTRHATTLDSNLPFFKDQRVFETQTARAVWAELLALGYPMHRLSGHGRRHQAKSRECDDQEPRGRADGGEGARARHGRRGGQCAGRGARLSEPKGEGTRTDDKARTRDLSDTIRTD